MSDTVKTMENKRESNGGLESNLCGNRSTGSSSNNAGTVNAYAGKGSGDISKGTQVET